MRPIAVIILTFLLNVVRGSVSFYTSSSNKLFVNLNQINETYVYYQHRMAVRNMIQIPCFLPSPDLSISAGDLVSYEWLMNGRQIRKNTPFIHGTWDTDGTLTVLAALIRLTTVWCHAKVEYAQDFYFAHQIHFFEEPMIHAVYNVVLKVPMPSDVLERKCRVERYTCDCRTEAGTNATSLFHMGLQNYPARDLLDEAAASACQQEPSCLTVSTDSFICMNDQTANLSINHIIFTFVLQPERNHGRLKQRTSDKRHEARNRIMNKLKGGIQKNGQKIVNYLKKNYLLIGTDFSVQVDRVHYEFCMGPSGRLSHNSLECELCPVGSYANSRLTSPAPPRIAERGIQVDTDEPYLEDKWARDSEVSQWLSKEHEKLCLPCPENTYAEELGRMVCMPCPDWHMMPEDPQGGKTADIGSDWLHEACPREGRAEIRLVQVAEGMLGTRFAEWIHASSPLTRVGTLLVLTLIPLVLAVMLLFIAYVLIDVGATLVKMANKIHPLQIQIAETTTATAQFKAEQRRAAAEAYANMKSK